MAHGAGPGAAHLGRIAPAALDDHQRIEQFLFPIGAPARLAPGQSRERGKHGTEMVLLHDRIAERGFHAPQPEQGDRRDAVILLDAREQRRKFLGALLAVGDAPFRDAAVEILPELFAEFRLRALQREHAHVGLQAAHHAVIGRLRNPARPGAGAEGFDPLLEGLRRRLRQRIERKRDRGRGSQGGMQAGTAR